MKFNTVSLTLSSLITLANAAKWKFNVVSIKEPTYDIGLKYNNQIIKMTKEAFPLFTTTIDSGSTKNYSYVVLDKDGNVVEEEKVKRTYNSNTASINEVYNRNNKSVNVPSLPKVYEPLFNSYQGKIKEFDDSKIYTLYANCEEDAYENLKYNPFINGNQKNENTANCTFSFVTPTDHYQTEGTIQLIGFDSRRYKKLSWKVKMQSKIFGRKTLKFRANANDVSFMRDKLSTELYKAVGVPTYSSAYARVIINDDVYGLYSIVDTVGKNWLASAIHGDDDAHTGTSYKTYAGANLKYLGNTKKNYNFGSYEVDEIDKADPQAPNEWYRLMDFTKLYEDWDKQYGNDKSEAAVKALEKFFNLESLLRQMVIESLTFAYDNFWANSGNYALYYNPEQMRYQINPYDFDGSFYGFRESSRFNKKFLEDPMDCINWAENARINKDNYFIGNLFKHENIKNRYNKIMSDTLNKVFNVESVSPLIDSLSNLIEEDIEWNFGLIDELDENIPGHKNHYTLQNFKDNTNYKKLNYKPKDYRDEAEYALKQWIKLRGNECSDYVKSVGINNNEEDEEEDRAAGEPEVVAPVVPDATVAPVKTTTTTVAPVKTTTTTVAPAKTTTTTKSKARRVKTVIKKVIVKKKKVVN